MLCLSHEIGCDPRGISVFADDDRFRWPGEEVNCAVEGNQLLRRSHVAIPRTNNFVHTGNRLRSVGERRNGLGSADTIEFANTQEACGSKGYLARAGRCDTDVLHSSNLRRNDRHQQRGGQRIAATGNVAAHGIQGPHQLAYADAGINFSAPFLWLQPFAIATNVGCCLDN